MTRSRSVLCVLIVFALAAIGAGSAPAPAPAPLPPASGSFVAIDVTLPPPAHGLGSYQVEITAPQGVRLVGVEGGDDAFSAPPYYDRAALQQNRVIIAAIAEPVLASAAPPVQINAAPQPAPAPAARKSSSRPASAGAPAPAGAPTANTTTPAAQAPAIANPPSPPLRVARLHFYFAANPNHAGMIVATVIAAGDSHADRLDPLPRADLKRATAPGE